MSPSSPTPTPDPSQYGQAIDRDPDDVASRKVHAPFTAAQVESLNDYQASGVFHPFTGRNELAPDGEDDILVATPVGWRSTRDPEYRQTWAWAWMADRSWEEMRHAWSR